MMPVYFNASILESGYVIYKSSLATCNRQFKERRLSFVFYVYFSVIFAVEMLLTIIAIQHFPYAYLPSW